MTDPRRQRFAPYLRLLADLMGLRDWTIELVHESPCEGDALASVVCVYGRRLARICVSDQFLDRSPEGQRYVCAHELVHCHMDAAWMIAIDSLDHAVHAAFRRMAEHGIDSIAEAWSVHLPLPDSEPVR